MAIRKTAMLMLVMAIFAAVPAFCDSVIDFGIQGGGILLNGNHLTGTTNLTSVVKDPFGSATPGIWGPALGNISLSTGTLLSQSAAQYVFSGAGSSILATSTQALNFNNGGSIASGNSLFTGAFSGPITLTHSGGEYWNLQGAVAGNLSAELAALMFPGSTNTSVSGMLLTLTMKQGRYTKENGQEWLIVSGDMSVPEPGTILVLGTGMIGLLGVFRKQFLQ